MGAAVSTKAFKRGHQDEKVENHCPRQLLSVQTKLGSVFCMYFVYIFVNSLLQRISKFILLNDFAFCFCFFRFR